MLFNQNRCCRDVRNRVSAVTGSGRFLSSQGMTLEDQPPNSESRFLNSKGQPLNPKHAPLNSEGRPLNSEYRLPNSKLRAFCCKIAVQSLERRAICTSDRVLRLGLRVKRPIQRSTSTGDGRSHYGVSMNVGLPYGQQSTCLDATDGLRVESNGSKRRLLLCQNPLPPLQCWSACCLTLV